MNTSIFRPLSLGAAVSLAAACTTPPNAEQVTYRTSLVRYQSCQALETDLKQLLEEEIDIYFDSNYRFGGPAEGGAPPQADPAAGDSRQAGTDYSGTNNQEEGVDEADFVKTDGYHVYTLNGNRLHIFGVPEFGELIPESEFEIEGWPTQMLINSEAGSAVVFSSVWVESLPEGHPMRSRVGRFEGDRWMWRTGVLTKVTVIDISDRTAPELQRELFIESSYQTARMVDTSVRMAAYSWMYIPGVYDWWYYGDESLAQAKRRAIQRIRALQLADLIPFIYERLPNGNVVTHSLSRNSCASFLRPTTSRGRGFTSILSLDLLNTTFQYDADHVLSNYGTVYSSSDAMYIAEATNDWWWFWWQQDFPDLTNIHRFDISQPGTTVYQGSGRVEGSLLNQFAMSEHQGYLRVATTTNRWGRWWLENPPEAENHLFVLGLDDGELVQVGHVGGIAPGESIFAARMIGDRGYIVTFLQIDPLFTLDLSDPTNPQVIGELEIPGFSTYIHPLAQDKLLTIGIGGDENGANWLTQISMFDVSNFAQPTVFDQEVLSMPGSWGWSEALYEHKAFQYWAPKNLLAVPMSSYRMLRQDGGDGQTPGEDDPWGGGWTWEYVSKLELITVDLEDGLSRYGSIDHSHLYNADPTMWWYYVDIRRSIFMGDFVYAISDRAITVHNLSDVDTVVAQELLPGYDPNSFYWWW